MQGRTKRRQGRPLFTTILDYLVSPLHRNFKFYGLPGTGIVLEFFFLDYRRLFH